METFNFDLTEALLTEGSISRHYGPNIDNIASQVEGVCVLQQL